MTEARRYLIQKTPIGTMMKPNADGNWVEASDYDAALEREASLREELARTKTSLEAVTLNLSRADDALSIANETIGQFADSLTAAEQRNSELVELLRDVYNQNELSGFDDRRILEVIEPQPTESGASE